MNENLLQFVGVIVSLALGIFTLWRQWRRDSQDQAGGRADDNREDYLAGNTAAGQVADAALRLVDPLKKRIKDLEDELAGCAELNRKALMDLSMRIDMAEREIEELKKINEELVKDNERLKNRERYLNEELRRLLTSGAPSGK